MRSNIWKIKKEQRGKMNQTNKTMQKWKITMRERESEVDFPKYSLDTY